MPCRCSSSASSIRFASMPTATPRRERSPAAAAAVRRRSSSRFKNIHIGIVTSSLGDHGGEVCVPNPADMPPRTLNDSAQLVASVRAGVYSYSNQGFLVWDPRTSRPTPDPHPTRGANEGTNGDSTEFVNRFTEHVAATGERGCGYEASLEAWYRFLIDPEPINQVAIVNNVNAARPGEPGGSPAARGLPPPRFAARDRHADRRERLLDQRRERRAGLARRAVALRCRAVPTHASTPKIRTRPAAASRACFSTIPTSRRKAAVTPTTRRAPWVILFPPPKTARTFAASSKCAASVWISSIPGSATLTASSCRASGCVRPRKSRPGRSAEPALHPGYRRHAGSLAGPRLPRRHHRRPLAGHRDGGQPGPESRAQLPHRVRDGGAA